MMCSGEYPNHLPTKSRTNIQGESGGTRIPPQLEYSSLHLSRNWYWIGHVLLFLLFLLRGRRNRLQLIRSLWDGTLSNLLPR